MNNNQSYERVAPKDNKTKEKSKIVTEKTAKEPSSGGLNEKEKISNVRNSKDGSGKIPPYFEEGITLDKYLGGNFKVIQVKNNYKNEFNKGDKKKMALESEGMNESRNSLNNEELEYLNEINETDEDMYNESNRDSTSQMSHRDKMSGRKYDELRGMVSNMRDSRLAQKIAESELIINSNEERTNSRIKKKIRDKYKNKASVKLHPNDVGRLMDDQAVEGGKWQDYLNSLEKSRDFIEKSNQKNMSKTSYGRKINYSQSPPHRNNEEEYLKRAQIAAKNKMNDKNYSTSSNYFHQPQFDQTEKNLTKYAKKLTMGANMDPYIEGIEDANKFEQHIAFRNTSNNFLRSSKYGKNFMDSVNQATRRYDLQDQVGGLTYNESNRTFTNSFYNTKGRETLNDFKNYSNVDPLNVTQGSSKFMNVMVSKENKFLNDKEKIKEKILQENINFVSKYRNRFNLNYEECELIILKFFLIKINNFILGKGILDNDLRREVFNQLLQEKKN
jgi:hypothetical protein